jgi:hypothetical protein
LFFRGIFWVSLAALSDPKLLLPTLAQTLGVDQRAGPETLPHTLPPRRS